VRYSGACFVMCIRLFISVYIQLIHELPIHSKIFFECDRKYVFEYPV
jgi:hypothetical protein